ncbi:hypothetical protein ACFL22_00900 [Patescibacteria group bacterium]
MKLLTVNKTGQKPALSDFRFVDLTLESRVILEKTDLIYPDHEYVLSELQFADFTRGVRDVIARIGQVIFKDDDGTKVITNPQTSPHDNWKMKSKIV